MRVFMIASLSPSSAAGLRASCASSTASRSTSLVAFDPPELFFPKLFTAAVPPGLLLLPPTQGPQAAALPRAQKQQLCADLPTLQ